MELKAFAKVNLTLEVLRRRGDGYHDLTTILQTIDLADDLVLEPHRDIVFHCEASGSLSDIEGENLVLRAANLLRAETRQALGARILLRKRIPVAAGLGGGSSDAAAALLGLDRLWGTRLPTSRLASLAATLGSDVPFFLLGGTALAEGRGELLTPLPPAHAAWFVLVSPPIVIANKTGALFKRLTPGMFTDGAATRALFERIKKGEPARPGDYFNAFERVAPTAFPGLESQIARFKQAGAISVHLSGAGPSLFAPVAGEAEGRDLERVSRALGLAARLVKTVAKNV